MQITCAGKAPARAHKCDFLAEIGFDLSPRSDDGEEAAHGEGFWGGHGRMSLALVQAHSSAANI